MEDLSKYDEDFFLFLEAGFIAINQADEDATKMFKACELSGLRTTYTKSAWGIFTSTSSSLK